ncbi:conserved hypothetical protein [delta proteobacterium NaphS2]|nr:conserved hypothetical protein [delta proteobacterium NaphS2]
MSRIRMTLPIFHSKFLSYAKGWKTKNKIIVIESDDWGAIRTSSREAYERLKSDGYALDKSPYALDSLETESDLTELYSVLDNIKDYRGRSACFTANMILANPDFAAIKASGFKDYFYEPAELALKRDRQRRNVLALWKEGRNRNIFIPQFHGREHIRYWEWLEALKNGSPEAHETFTLNMCGVPLRASKETQSFYLPMYLDDHELKSKSVNIKEVITEGVKLFEKTFGYRSLSTVAPNVTWTPTVEKIWYDNNINYIQGGLTQIIPNGNGGKRVAHYTGERSLFGGLYLSRNCTFEPSKSSDSGYWQISLKQIRRAFAFKEPAILSTHRVNYIGNIKSENRDRGLNQLKSLLDAVLDKWPDTIFLSTPELGFMIENNIQSIDALEIRGEQIFPLVS